MSHMLTRHRGVCSNGYEHSLMDAAALLSHLRNASSKPEAGAAAITSLIAPTGASSSAAWLVERLFESPTLLPIRRPNYFVHQ